MSLSWENRDIFAGQGDMTILTYFTCMVKIITLLIYIKKMQTIFFALFILEVTILVFHHVLQVKQIHVLLFYGLCSKRFEDISQEI